MRQKTETVSFRADTELLKAIDDQRHHFQISRGAWVRGIVITWLNQIHLENQTHRPNQDQLEAVGNQLERVLRNQAKSLYLEMTVIGGMSDDDARSLVKRQLIGEQ